MHKAIFVKNLIKKCTSLYNYYLLDHSSSVWGKLKPYNYMLSYSSKE